MIKFGLLIRIEAKEGKEAEVEKLLTSALALVEKDSSTIVWTVLRFSPSSFGIFDAFQDRDGQDFHLAGPVLSLLSENTKSLLTSPPAIEKLEILAEKITIDEIELDGPPIAGVA